MPEPAGGLIWSDEFDAPAGSPPDPRWWVHETGGHGWGNGELQDYTALPENACHDGQGNLAIRALRKGDGFSSARLTTKGRFAFRYGRLECRALLPGGAGLWSAVWTLGGNIDRVPWPGCGEIDVVESIGREPGRVFGTVHCPGHSGRDGLSGDFVSPVRFHSSFRVFTVDWSPRSISWSVDGTRYFAVSRDELASAWVFDHPFYILVNLAVGGWLGGEVGRDTAFPAEMKIDYIRIYDLPALPD